MILEKKREKEKKTVRIAVSIQVEDNSYQKNMGQLRRKCLNDMIRLRFISKVISLELSEFLLADDGHIIYFL